MIVAGGGIGGLTVALALAKTGIRSLVLERSPTPQQAGAGIQITPNAGRILAELGLEGDIDRLCSKPEAMHVRSWRGKRIVTLPFGPRFARRYGAPYRTIHRSDLLKVLLDATEASELSELSLGQTVVEFALHPRGLTVMAEQGGHHVEYSASGLIAADGVGSFVRSVMPGGRPRLPTRHTAWRTIVQATDAPQAVDADIIGLWLGPNGHIVHYPVRGGSEFNVVVVSPDTKSRGTAGFDEVRHRFRRWADPVLELLDTGHDWEPWPIATVHPSGPWASGPVALLGDAAHAMTPYLAQGGAMAIEDAAVLASALSAAPDDVETAFARYSLARKPRVRRVWRAARGTAELYHMGAVTGSIRNVAMRLLGGGGLGWRYRWIYRWRPPKGKTRRPRTARSVSQNAKTS